MSEKKIMFSWTKLKEMICLYFKNNWWKLLVIVGVVFVDMLTKILIVRFDELGNVITFEKSILGNVIVIMPTKNIGAGFSILSGHQTLLVVFTFLFLIALSVFDFCFQKKSKLFAVSTGLIFAGAIGNLIDRLAFNAVRDFIYLKFINFPVFNVADIALTIGVVLIAIYVIFYSGKKETQVDTSSQTSKNNDLTIQNKNSKTTQNESAETMSNIIDLKNEHKNNENNTIDIVDTKSQYNKKDDGDSDAKDNC